VAASDFSSSSVVHRRLRLVALAIGVGVILWLPFEDTGVNGVLAFSVLICGWWAARSLLNAPISEGSLIRRHVFFAALAGLGVSPLALLLMALKTGLHSHPSPDYSPEQLGAVLVSTPVWVLASVLLGVGSGLWRVNRGAEDARRE
jgi:hypothetical protein